MKWSYGITTCKDRRDTTLPVTIQSLKRAGFDNPRLFVDMADDSKSWFNEFGLLVSVRHGTIRTFGNWWLGIWELYLREPSADYYAMFQDDFLTYIGLKSYLESNPCPKNGYMNLYTFCYNGTMNNEAVIKDKEPGWYEGCRLWTRNLDKTTPDDPPMDFLQCGLGAVALVFSHDALIKLLGSEHLLQRSEHPEGWRKIDGGIVSAMNKTGYREYIHNPSLVQHIGEVSTMRNAPHPQARSFRGEKYDIRELLRK